MVKLSLLQAGLLILCAALLGRCSQRIIMDGVVATTTLTARRGGAQAVEMQLAHVQRRGTLRCGPGEEEETEYVTFPCEGPGAEPQL